MSTDNGPKYHVPALEKGLDIIEALSSSLTPLSLTDLSRQLNRTRNELFRMLSYLEARGFIIKDERSGNYTLSLKLYELAHKHAPVRKLLSHARPYMEDFARENRETCHVAVIDRGQLVVLDQVLSPEIYRFMIQVGSRQPLLHTTSGRLLLAHMPAEQCAALLARDPDYALLSADERLALNETFTEILDQGYSYRENETLVGIHSISVLIGNPAIGVVASLAVASLTFAKDHRDTHKLIEQMQIYARNITHSIGLDHDRQNDLL